jgi:formate dehydrogenase alpha subunit
VLTINGVAVPVRGSVLDCCLQAGIDIPAWCHKNGRGGGHCRSCLVEIGGRTVAACTTAAEDGMNIATDTEALRAYRRDLGELTVAEARPGATVGRSLAALGIAGDRYPKASVTARRDASHPYLRLDLSACIRCRLCEDACDHIQGQFVYGFRGRGATTELAFGASSFKDSACVACGACVSACPTGAITDLDRETQAPTRSVRTTCGYCGVGCQLDVHTDGEQVLRVGGADAAVNRGHLCVKGRYAHGFARHADRLRTPLIRKNGALVPCSWDEAIATVAREFSIRRGHIAALSSSRATNEENYLLQKWMRAALGTHNVDCCARVCHAPTAQGMRTIFGTGAATNSFADIERADTILVAGANCTESHPVIGARIRQAALRGARLIVIDPRRTELAAMADVHLELVPGTNVLLLNSFACALIEGDFIRDRFIAERTEGFEQFSAFVTRYPPESTERTTGVPAGAVRAAARFYGCAERPLEVHGLGMTEHYQGSESVMQLANLALLVGAIGRQGVGINPLRGQNNVQGAADMGCAPDSVTGYQNPRDDEVRRRFEAVWQRPMPEAAGLTLPKMYEQARTGEIKAMFIFGEDVVQSDPSVHVEPALAALEFLVVEELFLSATARRADVVLPGASVFEKDGTFTNAERRIQRVRRVLEPPGDARPDWQILCELMAATGYPQTYQSPADIMNEIARVAPLFAGVSYDRLDRDGLQWPVSEDGADSPILHERSFPIGRARFAIVEYAPSPALAVDVARYPLRLTTGRVLEHYNCGSMTRRSKNAELRPDDRLELHAGDAARAGVRSGERAHIQSPFGETDAVVAISDRMPAGTAFLSFHYTETGANKLTSATLDRLADCPEYKVIPVAVTKANPS